MAMYGWLPISPKRSSNSRSAYVVIVLDSFDLTMNSGEMFLGRSVSLDAQKLCTCYSIRTGAIETIQMLWHLCRCYNALILEVFETCGNALPQTKHMVYRFISVSPTWLGELSGSARKPGDFEAGSLVR